MPRVKKREPTVLVCTRYPEDLLDDLVRSAKDLGISAGAWVVSACQAEEAVKRLETQPVPVSETFCIRWPAKDLKRVQKAAKRHKITFSEYLRRAVRAAL